MSSDSIIHDANACRDKLLGLSASDRHNMLLDLEKALRIDKESILSANELDIETAEKNRQSDVVIDRLRISEDKFEQILYSIRQIAKLPDLVGEIYDVNRQKSGIVTSKMKVPVGVILMIYESRPNVTIDAAALAIKTANSMILKGGKEAQHTNLALGDSITRTLGRNNLKGAIQVLLSGNRALLDELIKKDTGIDLVIPRGGRHLLEYIRSSTTIPTLLHMEGNCHVYIDKGADVNKAFNIVIDSKTQRLGTCNTVESLLVHKDMTGILSELTKFLIEQGIEIRGDDNVCHLINNAKHAEDSDWSEEYLGPIISVKVVDSLEEAIAHVNLYGSGHTDTIVTEDSDAANRFIRGVDSSSVMHNTSTRLADGFEYGLGAEIGISTGKLHARGPVGQEGLMTYKWVVRSDGVTKGDIVHNNYRLEK